MLYFSDQAAKSRESACQWYSRLLLLAACSLFFNAFGLCALVTVSYRNTLTDEIGSTFGIDFTKKRLALADIKKILGDVKNKSI
jgi:hypothetical protein